LPLPSARGAAWRPPRPDELTHEQQQTAELPCRLSPEVGQAQQIAPSLIEAVKERAADGLRGWLVNARRGEVAEFITFAGGLTADLRAVRAALDYEWSNGQTGGASPPAQAAQAGDLRAREARPAACAGAARGLLRAEVKSGERLSS
jgi:hypothetical protein